MLTRDQALFWFGWHYDSLDLNFRRKKWADPIAVQVFVRPSKAFGMDYGDACVVEVHYDTETMTYLRLKYLDTFIELNNWDI